MALDEGKTNITAPDVLSSPLDFGLAAMKTLKDAAFSGFGK